jgi:hypothetical protein
MPLADGRLALGDYAAGAAFATDLVNTVAGLRAGDTLTDVGELRALLGRHGIEPHPAPGARDLSQVRALRAALLEVFDASDAVAALNALLDGPAYALQMDENLTWTAALRPEARLAERLQVLSALSLLAVVTTLGADRFRACEAGDCSGVFVDTSRSGRRRYCRPSICGNRHNVAAYRRRARRGAAGTRADRP